MDGPKGDRITKPSFLQLVTLKPLIASGGSKGNKQSLAGTKMQNKLF